MEASRSPPLREQAAIWTAGRLFGRHGTGAVVAKVEDAEGTVVGAQRIFIDPHGKAVKNEYTADGKRSYGSIKGNVVRFKGTNIVAESCPIIAEGVITGLTVWQAFEGQRSVWCTLGLDNLGDIPMPPGEGKKRVVIVADADGEDSEAADTLVLGVDKLHGRGIETAIAMPDGTGGYDANDLLKDKGRDAVRKLVNLAQYELANAAYRTRADLIRRKRGKAANDNAPIDWDQEPASSEEEPTRAFVDLTACDEASLPRRDMLAEDLFERGKTSITAGQGGTVKSTFALYVGLALASGQHAGPIKPTRAYNVGYVGVEDSLTEQRRRMFALLHLDDLRGIKLPQQGNLFEQGGSFHTLECDVVTLAARNEESGKIIPTDTYFWLKREIERLKLDMLIIDPLVEITEGVNENDNAHMQKVMALLRSLARGLNIHLNIVHHFNKPGEANNPGAVRGGSAIINAARMNINLEKANETDCKAYGINESDRYCRIKMVIPKANNTPTGMTNWFAIEEVLLKNGDRVAGIQHWNPLDEQEPVTPSVMNDFLDALERGRVDKKGEPTGERYSGKFSGRKEARADQLLVKAGASQAAAKALIKRLTNEGIIGEREYYSEATRHTVSGLVVLKRPSSAQDIPF